MNKQIADLIMIVTSPEEKMRAERDWFVAFFPESKDADAGDDRRKFDAYYRWL